MDLEKKEVSENMEPKVKKEIEKKERPISQIPPMRVYALGGLGEVGKNMYIVEQGLELWIIDSGVKFASDDITIEGIIPSFEWLKMNQKRIKGLIVTHGHEDHIGSIPHLLTTIKVPRIFAGRFTANLIYKKLSEKKVPKIGITIIDNKWKWKTLNFKISTYNINHSIPDSYGILFESRHGSVFLTGDFKFDLTPVGKKCDIARLAEIGSKGITLLLGDSTNSERQTFSESEKDVSIALEPIIKEAKGRVIVASFASNVYRVREVIKIAVKYDRKIAVFGWSMDKVVSIARKIKYINLKEDMFVDSKNIKNVDDNKLLVLSTGTQGEQNAALNKMSEGKMQHLKLNENDTVILASGAIPGNYASVERMVNNIVKRGVTVFDNKKVPEVHASGHGGRIEQLLMLNLINPTYFMPIHGEMRMQSTHIKTAIHYGIPKDNCFLLENGRKLEIFNGEVKVDAKVPAEDIYVDDSNLYGQSLKVVSDRNTMSANGVVTILVGINSKRNEIIIKPQIKTKGNFKEQNNKSFIEKLSNGVEHNLNKYYEGPNKITFLELKNIIRETGETFIFDKFKIKPIVIPIILNYSQE